MICMLQQLYTMLYTLPTQPEELGYWCILKSPFHIQNDVKEIQWHKHTILFSCYLFFGYTVANKLKFFTWNIRNFDIILYHITFIRIRLSLLQILFRLRVFSAPLSTIFLLYRCGSLLQSRTYLQWTNFNHVIFFPLSPTRLYTRVTRWVSYKKQELLTVGESLNSSCFWWGPCCSYV